MKRAFRKIKKRYRLFKQHPVSSNHPRKALGKYIWFNIISRLRKNITIHWIEKLTFQLSRGDAGLVGNVYYGLYEFEESIFLLHFLSSEDIFLDIGANNGHYTLLASGIKNAQTIAIEPIPKSFEKLKVNIQLNKLEEKVILHNVSLANKNGALYFSNDKNTMNRIVSKSYKDKIKVVVSTLDELVNNQPIVMMKIDVEGFEKFVFDGGIHTLAQPSLQVIIVELNNSGLQYGIKDEEVISILTNNGFSPYSYDYKTQTLDTLDSHNKTQFNTIFIKDLEWVTDRLLQSKTISIWNKQF